MNLKRILYYFIFLIIIFYPNNIFAHSAASGTSSFSGSCSGYDWCYNGEGIRLSLYKYDGKTLTFYKSIDYETTFEWALNGKVAYASVSAGKVAYQNKKATIKWTKSKLEINQKKFTCFHGSTKCKSFEGNTKKEIIKYLELESKNPSKIIKQINNVFDSKLKESDIENIYITVEPTFYIFGKENKKQVSYYGTIYELSVVSGGKSHSGIDRELFYNMPQSIFASNPTGNDSKNFVSKNKNSLVVVINSSQLVFQQKNSNCSVIWNSSNSCANNIRTQNYKKAISTEGYGIGVFWLGDYVSSCKKTCTGKSGDALLSCAEKYCKDSKNSNIKSECITSCGYQRPPVDTCGSDTKGSASKSSCEQTVRKSKTTCSVSGYVKTVCTETTTIKYPNTLPITLNVGKNLNYSLTTQGIKDCTVSFNYNLFKFDYATQTGSSGRNSLINSLTYASKADSYAYSSAWQANSIKIDNSSYNFSKQNVSTKTEQTKSNTATIKLYADGNESPRSIYSSKIFKSTNNLTFNLNPAYKISNSYLGKKINTTIVIRKDSSNLNDTNTCNITVPKNNTPQIDYGCDIKVISGNVNSYGKYTSDVQIEFVPYYRVNGSNSAFPNNTAFKFNSKNQSGKSTIKINKQTGKTVSVPGEVTVNGTKKTCSIKIEFADKENCKLTVVEKNNKLLATLDKKGTIIYTKGKDSSSFSNTTSQYFDKPTSGKIKIEGKVGESLCGFVEYEAQQKKCKLNFEASEDKKTIRAYFTTGQDYEIGDIEIKGDVEKESCTPESCEIKRTEYDTVTISGTLNNISCGEVTYNAEKTPKCTELFKSTALNKIREYCNNYYSKDLDKYDSADDCIKKCSNNNACYSLPNEEMKKNWCTNNYSTNGYKSAQSCYNDCITAGRDLSGIEYIYRPISLGNAFPDRRAGINWVGQENKTKENVFKNTPKYVILLNKDTIKDIKQDTKNKGKKVYIQYEGKFDSKTNYYTSDFLSSLMKKGILERSGK